MSQLIRAIVVDDSAFVRKVVREMLSRSPYIEVVGVARDGEEALHLVESLKPDVVTCDLIMPRLDGVSFVRKQMARHPLPILILTSSPQDGEQVLEALNAGAVDLVQKPTALATEELLEIREQLVEKVKSAALAPVGKLLNGEAHPTLAPLTSTQAHRVDIVVLGISTGGPQALRRLIPEFPANFPVPIAMVLHMPVGYTALFAEKLDELSALDVCEAKDGDVLRPGLALLAPAGRHLSFRRTPSGTVVAQLSVHPLEKNHRPSADVLFQSAAETFGARVLGVIMTGMGEDGRDGCGWIKAQGGTILTEDEKTCIIYGMPRAVVEAGLSDRAVPLDRMAQTIIDHL
jgi:two-component system, chemotaxis family, protein-glutamate methylesterase/glutaminase